MRALIALAALLPALAFGQAHQVREGSYTLRSSTVASTLIDPRTAHAHGIEPASDRMVLNVLVQRDERGRHRNVSARVHATASNLAGMPRDIPMREARADNGDISYVGSFTHAPREVLDFAIRAEPQGTDQALSLHFRDRMPAH